MMTKWIRNLGLLIAVMVMTSTSVWAKDMCVTDNFGEHWKFSKVKMPKAGKGAVPLTGIYVQSGTSVPVAGTMLKTSGGQTKIGVFVHAMAPIIGNNVTLSLIVDDTFTGNGQYDYDGNYTADGAWNWTGVDCSTVTVE